jgi:prepilin-type N-terminal cleavage/methylation domain-containing protein
MKNISKKSAVYGLRSAVSPRAGFTLLELMTVMFIMFILMGMATLALRGLMRGTGISGAVSTVRSVLTLARQQAIVHQLPTAVFLPTSGSTNTMRILTSYGRVTSGAGGGFIPEVELPWSAGELGGTEVYNFRGGAGKFTGEMGPAGDYITSGITWSASDDIVFQIGAVRSLPDGIVFGDLPAPPIVVFEADGSAREGLEIELKEISAPPGTDGIVVKVDKGTGWIKVSEPGE